MEYRRLNYSTDIQEVVALIKRNLNKNYSEDILRWKHLDSPNGKSAGLVAVEENRIVGIVFTVLYSFQNASGEKMNSVRFFDACTEPDQRGKGIFKTLMKLGFETYQNEYDFSFSNPNKASLKGHLRVGYMEPPQSRFYRFGLIRPIIGKIGGKLQDFKDESVNDRPLTKQNFYLSGNSGSFLKWRYREKRYNILEHTGEGQSNYIVYRIEKKKGLRAIVICDFQGDLDKIYNVINLVCRKERTFFIYYLENRINSRLNFLFTRKYKKAVIVFKNDTATIPGNLIISLGDLEGRL